MAANVSSFYMLLFKLVILPIAYRTTNWKLHDTQRISLSVAVAKPFKGIIYVHVLALHNCFPSQHTTSDTTMHSRELEQLPPAASTSAPAAVILMSSQDAQNWSSTVHTNNSKSSGEEALRSTMAFTDKECAESVFITEQGQDEWLNLNQDPQLSRPEITMESITR